MGSNIAGKISGAGVLIALYGLISSVMYFFDYNLRILMWVDLWGPLVGWGIRGALIVGGGLVAFMGSMSLIGLIPTVPIFIISYMRIEGREPWKITLAITVAMTFLVYVLFDQLLTIPWPPSVIGDMFPALKFIPSV